MRISASNSPEISISISGLRVKNLQLITFRYSYFQAPILFFTSSSSISFPPDIFIETCSKENIDSICRQSQIKTIFKHSSSIMTHTCWEYYREDSKDHTPGLPRKVRSQWFMIPSPLIKLRDLIQIISIRSSSILIEDTSIGESVCQVNGPELVASEEPPKPWSASISSKNKRAQLSVTYDTEGGRSIFGRDLICRPGYEDLSQPRRAVLSWANLMTVT